MPHIMDQIFKVPKEISYISFKTGERVRNSQDLGITIDGRLLTLEMDRSGRIIGISLI